MSDQTIALKSAFLEQDRLRLFVERNKFKDLAERYERQLADENHPTLKMEVANLQRQLHAQHVHSIIVIGVLFFIIALLLGGYILCPDYMTAIYPSGNSWFTLK